MKLQGHIWQKGFDAGELRGQLFPDVAPQLQKWHSQGIKVYVYSSGSREAQRMLMANSTEGDLRAHISGFFDTAVGAKVSSLRSKSCASEGGGVLPCLIISPELPCSRTLSLHQSFQLLSVGKCSARLPYLQKTS